MEDTILLTLLIVLVVIFLILNIILLYIIIRLRRILNLARTIIGAIEDYGDILQKIKVPLKIAKTLKQLVKYLPSDSKDKKK